MRGGVRPFITILAAAVLAAGAPVGAQLIRPAAPGLTVWADAEFRGTSHTFTSDVPDISASGMGRLISSLRTGPGETWEVCSEPNYGGRCRIFSTGVSDLRSAQLNDAIMSVRRLPEPPRPPATTLELYVGANYTGRQVVVREATPDFRRIDFSDRALSLRVPANQTWEICVNIDYDDCRLVSENVPDLTAIGLNRLISSARPRLTGRGRGGPVTPPSSRPQLVLFDGPNFSGRSVTIGDDQPSLTFFSSYTGSIRVLGGEWQLCDRARFFGNCVAVSESVRDLSRLTLRGPVLSIRRQP